jgi:hypothetical protein
MEPLNKQERSEAFLKVLALFVVSIILMAIPMYYAFMLPCKEKKHDSSECDNLRKQRDQMQLSHYQFLLKTDSALYIFNKYAHEKTEFAREKWRPRYPLISNEMEDFTNTIPDDTLKSLYTNVRHSFDKLFTRQDTIFEILKPIPIPDPIPPEPVGQTFYKLVKDTYYKNNRNKRLTGDDFHLEERTVSFIVKDLHL